MRPVYMDCPGGGHPGNLRTDSHAHCQFCHKWLELTGGLAPEHRTEDILAMIEQGDSR